MLSYSEVLYVFSVREPQRIVRYQLVTDCLPCPVLSVLSTQRMLCSVIVRWKIEIGCGDTNGDDAIRYAMRCDAMDEDRRRRRRQQTTPTTRTHVSIFCNNFYLSRTYVHVSTLGMYYVLYSTYDSGYILSFFQLVKKSVLGLYCIRQ